MSDCQQIKLHALTSVFMVEFRMNVIWGHGVAHAGAQVKQRCSVSIILSCNSVTQQVGGKANHSNHIPIKLHCFTSVLIVHAQKSMRWGQGVAHGGAKMKQKHLVSIILSGNVVT